MNPVVQADVTGNTWAEWLGVTECNLEVLSLNINTGTARVRFLDDTGQPMKLHGRVVTDNVPFRVFLEDSITVSLLEEE